VIKRKAENILKLKKNPFYRNEMHVACTNEGDSSNNGTSETDGRDKANSPVSQFSILYFSF
jgi:hypothetical protein